MGSCMSSTAAAANLKHRDGTAAPDDEAPIPGSNEGTKQNPTSSVLSPSVTLQNLLNKPNLADVRNVGERGIRDVGTKMEVGAHHLRNVFAKPLEMTWGTSYQPPMFPKSETEKETLEEMLKQNYVFENLKHAQIFPLVQALEKTTVEADATIIRQGDRGDWFYVLYDGVCDFLVDNAKVGSAERGDSFGELALLYDAPRAATVKAATDCTLYRVDQAAFRHILQAQAQSGEETKTELLSNVVFLKDLAASERSKLASVMTPKPFKEGDLLMKKGESLEHFIILKEGKVNMTDIGKDNIRYEDTTVGPGEYMGEGAITANVPNFFNATALTDGMAFVIDRRTFQKVLGDLDGLIIRSLDRKFLVRVVFFVVVVFLALQFVQYAFILSIKGA